MEDLAHRDVRGQRRGDPRVYPERFRLPQVTEHVLAWLERRRPGFGEWSGEVEAQLLAEARLALADVAHRLERGVFTVVLPRYFQLARREIGSSPP